MKASIVELRTKMKEITQALGRREIVTVFSHGKAIGQLSPILAEKKSMSKKRSSVTEHLFFGSDSETQHSVEETVNALRQPRFK